MNPKYLEKMSVAELDDYAKAIGIPKLVGSTEDRIKTISKRRSKKVIIRALGVDWEVPVKAMSDKRVTECVANLNDENGEKVLRIILGEEQFEKLEEVCTEEDGTFDLNALGTVYTKIVTSRELKNA